MNVTEGADGGGREEGGEEDDAAPREWGALSHVARRWDPRNGSKPPIASIVLPNVPVSDTSNLARSTIRRVILANASLPGTGIPSVEFIYRFPTFLKRPSDTAHFPFSSSSISTSSFYL